MENTGSSAKAIKDNNHKSTINIPLEAKTECQTPAKRQSARSQQVNGNIESMPALSPSQLERKKMTELYQASD